MREISSYISPISNISAVSSPASVDVIQSSALLSGFSACILLIPAALSMNWLLVLSPGEEFLRALTRSGFCVN